MLVKRYINERVSTRKVCDFSSFLCVFLLLCSVADAARKQEDTTGNGSRPVVFWDGPIFSRKMFPLSILDSAKELLPLQRVMAN